MHFNVLCIVTYGATKMSLYGSYIILLCDRWCCGMGMHNNLHVRAWAEYYPINLLKVGSLNTTLPVLIVH